MWHTDKYLLNIQESVQAYYHLGYAVRSLVFALSHSIFRVVRLLTLVQAYSRLALQRADGDLSRSVHVFHCHYHCRSCFLANEKNNLLKIKFNTKSRFKTISDAYGLESKSMHTSLQMQCPKCYRLIESISLNPDSKPDESNPHYFRRCCWALCHHSMKSNRFDRRRR